MNDNNDSSAVLYLLAGVGIGAVIGAAAGILFAPKAGPETRDELNAKLKEVKHKLDDWMSEQKAKKLAADAAEEVGA